MAHTPGPWTVTCDADDDNERPLEIVVDNDWNRRIAFPASDGNPDDARLIAAAPELLAALKAVLTVWHDATATRHDDAAAEAAALAAIAKAEGST
jgi:hypothetical protein